MNETPKKRLFHRQTQSHVLIVLAALATLVAVFYLEEDWRGKRAWENCKRQIEAQGIVLDWDQFIPPPVPDDQNIFKAPKIQEWFVKNPNFITNELSVLTTNVDKVAIITNKTVAENFLTWSDRFQPGFDLMREALKRPYARMDGDYTRPYQIPIDNFVNVRNVAQTLAQRAKCDLLLGRPDAALNELTLLDNSRRLMERAPTGKPITLVDAMINVAVSGLYAQTIAGGIQNHEWQESQLAALQEQLQKINLPPIVFESQREVVPAFLCRDAEIIPPQRWLENWGLKASRPMKALLWLIPRGWVYQNTVVTLQLEQLWWNGFDPASQTVFPQKLDAASQKMERELGRHHSPFYILADVDIPNFTIAWRTTAYNQTLVNENQIACALERYHLAHGEYPETLDALAPQFIENLPHDLIGGQPLHYQRAEGGKFLLYSVGWNETDDGGVTVKDNLGNVDKTKGDWVWQ